jgi:hypothetical protein
VNEAGLSYAERDALTRRCQPLGVVLDLIGQVPCEAHGKQAGEACEPRACLARAEFAGLRNLITLAEFALVARQP